jgi:hypothetical protein
VFESTERSAPADPASSGKELDDDVVAQAFLHELLLSAKIAPLSKHGTFVAALHAMGLGGDGDILREVVLSHDFNFAAIGMQRTQARSLLRYLRAAAVPASPELASAHAGFHEQSAKACLLDALNRAKFLPADTRGQFADKLYESGIGDEVALRECLLAAPPDLDLLSEAIGMTPVQKMVLLKFLASAAK